MTESILEASTVGDDRTIVAIATPMGRAALATLRASGPGVRALAAAMLDPVPSIPRRATHTTVRDANGSKLDDVVATFYSGPHTFTGEDLLEISTHGGFVVPTAVLAAAIRAGAREAEPGEFTRRAVLNGKLDLLQAEAIGDLIDARTSAAHVLAVRQLDGGLSQRVQALRQQLLALEALLAYDIDFPEEDDGPISRERITLVGEQLQEALETLLATADQGTLVHDGVLVVLAGAPNVGKSSLFNALLGEARAIVTEQPGTTRDAIEAMLDLPNWPLRLVDTAGLHETSNIVEQIGIEISARYLSRAAIVLACFDSPETAEAVAGLHERVPGTILTVATKSDLAHASSRCPADIAVSAQTGEGLASLLGLITAKLVSDQGAVNVDTPMLTRARHRVAIEQATEETKQFLTGWTVEMLPASVVATHVRVAENALSELIGAVHVDDVLDVVFRSFCVGK